MTCSTPCQLKAVILSCPGCLVVTIQHKQLNQRAARRVLATAEASWSRGTVCHLPRTENETPLWLQVSNNLVCYVLLTNKEDERTPGAAQPTGFTTRLNQLTLQVSRPHYEGGAILHSQFCRGFQNHRFPYTCTFCWAGRVDLLMTILRKHTRTVQNSAWTHFDVNSSRAGRRDQKYLSGYTFENLQ